MICFVILHYIAIEETYNCVKSILDNVVGNKKIIIVDNASPNNSGNLLESKYKNVDEVDVVLTDTNMGFARGNNVGYKYAIDMYSPDFIVVMNNDMEIKQYDFIDQIYQSYDQYHYSIMGPDIYSTKKKYHQNPQNRDILSYKKLKKLNLKFNLKYRLKFIIYLKWFIVKMFKGSKRKETQEVDNFESCVVENALLHGSCYVFSKIYIDNHKVSCFYDKTFMYMEAEILYYLANINDEKIIYYPYIKVDHHEDVSTDAEFSKQYKKSIFSIKCLLQSSKAFLELMEKNDRKEIKGHGQKK